jgi:hypothetical protein
VYLCVPLSSISCKALRKIPGTMFASRTISKVTFMHTKRTQASVQIHFISLSTLFAPATHPLFLLSQLKFISGLVTAPTTVSPSSRTVHLVALARSTNRSLAQSHCSVNKDVNKWITMLL